MLIETSSFAGMILNKGDSAAAGAWAIAAKGARRFVLLVRAAPMPRRSKSASPNSLSVYGTRLAVTVTYDTNERAAKAVADVKELVEAPEAILIATGGSNPAFVAAALKSEGLLGEGHGADRDETVARTLDRRPCPARRLHRHAGRNEDRSHRQPLQGNLQLSGRHHGGLCL